MSKGRCILIVSLFLVLSLISVVGAQEEQVLKITTYGVCYANLHKEIQVPPNTSTLTLEYKIKGEGISGYSYGPTVALYWHPGKSLGLKINSSSDGSMRSDLPALTDTAKLNRNDWLDVKVILTRDQISFFAKDSGDDEWITYYEGPRPKGYLYEDVGHPTGIVIGTGHREGEPYLRHSLGDLTNRGIGRVYFDNITLNADDKNIFYEEFKGTLDALKLEYDMAADPRNKEPVFELVAP